MQTLCCFCNIHGVIAQTFKLRYNFIILIQNGYMQILFYMR